MPLLLRDKENDFWLLFLLVIEGKHNVPSQHLGKKKKDWEKKPQSHWDLNQISINYAAYGLHKTFRGARGGQALSGCWLVKPVKAAVEMEDMTVAGDSLATA